LSEGGASGVGERGVQCGEQSGPIAATCGCAWVAAVQTDHDHVLVAVLPGLLLAVASFASRLAALLNLDLWTAAFVFIVGERVTGVELVTPPAARVDGSPAFDVAVVVFGALSAASSGPTLLHVLLAHLLLLRLWLLLHAIVRRARIDRQSTGRNHRLSIPTVCSIFVYEFALLL